MENLTLGERIRLARENRGMLQTDLARKLGVAQETVSRWETGASVPRDRMASRIAMVLGLVIEETTAEREEPELLESLLALNPADRQMVRDLCERLVTR